MRKILATLAAAVLMASMLSVTVFAGRHHGYRGGYAAASANPAYAQCAVDDCDIYGPHQHDNAWYCNQAGVNWAGYAACAVDGCDELGFHAHDGQWYHCPGYPNGGGSGSGSGYGGGRGCYRW